MVGPLEGSAAGEVKVASPLIDLSSGARDVPSLVPSAPPATAKSRRTYELTRYRVKVGDTAWSVARQFGVSTMTIWWANRMEAWERLRVGQSLRVLPVSGIEHVVRDGDTLDSIARDYHAQAEAIAEYNGLVGGVVLLGQRIIVPDGRGGRYVALDDIPRSSSIPRLAPGQADRAPVDHLAVATPLLTPAPSSTPGVKESGGVAWPVEPDWTAGPVGPVSEPYVPAWDWGPFPGETDGGSLPPGVPPPGDGSPRQDVPVPTPSRYGQGRSERGEVVGRRSGEAADEVAEGPRRGRSDRPQDDADGPDIVIPPDAPVPGGQGARDLDWPDGGPPPGPPQGRILTIDDDRLTLTEEVARQERSLLWPVYGGGLLTQEFHSDHSGIDIADLRGTPLLAAQDGRVVFAGWRDDRAGRIVHLKHGSELFTSYGHMWRVAVRAGDWVKEGQVIGYMGSTGYSTGSHVHFTVTAGPLPNYEPDTRDPLLFLRRP
ncbi:MAG: peptidoglycan DD-metalloendopeptidase family protein [Chloroflexota bacterium]|nr:peptidoglycan DD-metalloendopeptidase family protein [Chloroflexota bacterium]